MRPENAVVRSIGGGERHKMVDLVWKNQDPNFKTFPSANRNPETYIGW